ncbi:hypothetical protein [Plantactinospora sp. GCM10030261]|uniref:hypothetical protein n=1 Tax=Plantactinospora sp. GCM10030261 TaxID=3273420 RepID=UPI003606E948
MIGRSAVICTVPRQAKSEKKAAYFVSTGGVNDTNWTEVLTALVACGTVDYYKKFAQEWLTREGKPWQATMKWIDRNNNYVAKSDVIQGGSCHLRIEGDITDIDYFHKKIEIPVYNGPSHYNAITERVSDIIDEMLDAGADKVVWMGYYDISPAQIDLGAFGETYRQKVSKTLQDMLPGHIPLNKRPLLDDPGWQQTVGAWTTAMNQAIWQGVPNHPKVRFANAPVLGTGDIQQTAFGGCPHPNEPGHTALANRLNQMFG